MAKRTNRAASALAYVAALGLAFGASAAHWDIQAHGVVTYATEVFGANADQELDLVTDDDEDTADVDERTRVEFVLYKPDNNNPTPLATTAQWESGSEIVLTVELGGASFGNTVQINDFELSPASSADTWELVSGSKVGGRAGTDFVEVGIKATAILNADPNVQMNNPELLPKVTLKIPAIEDAAGLATAGAKVTVTGSVELQGTSGVAATDFPTEVVGPRVLNDPATPDVDESTNPVTMMPKYTSRLRTFATSANALTFSTSVAGAGAIALPERTALANKAKSMVLGGLSVTEAEDPPMTADLEEFSLAEGGKADIDITVTGGIRSDDQVFFDLDRDGVMDDGEELDIDDGEATGDFRLDDNKDLPASVRYVPGDEDMSRTTFSTQFSVEFDSAAGGPDLKPVEASLGYAGVDLEARAYAIPNPGSMDMGNIRIRCETSNMDGCHAYLECDDQVGNTLFGDAGEIASGATMHLMSLGVANVLGVDTWEGRLACDVLSSEAASVQVLVRSGGSLVNNTYVDDLNPQ